MNAAFLAVCGFVGLAVGSFLNVVIYRVPKGLSIVSPPSACPHCNAPIKPWDNIPLVSWLVLRGKCRQCHGPISWRYPAVELSNAVLFVGAAIRLGRTWEVAAYLVLLAGIFALAIIDFETLTLPRSIVWWHLGLVSTLLFSYSAATGYWRHLVVGIVCALAWSAIYLLIHLISPRSMGFGDVRFALVLGLALGYINVADAGLGFLLANLVGLVISVALIATKQIKKNQPVPYGIFLAAGTALAFFFSSTLTQPFTYHLRWI